MQKEVLWVLYTFTNHRFNICFFKRLSFLRFSNVAFSMLAAMFPLSEGKIGPTRKICLAWTDISVSGCCVGFVSWEDQNSIYMLWFTLRQVGLRNQSRQIAVCKLALMIVFLQASILGWSLYWSGHGYGLLQSNRGPAGEGDWNKKKGSQAPNTFALEELKEKPSIDEWILQWICQNVIF